MGGANSIPLNQYSALGDWFLTSICPILCFLLLANLACSVWSLALLIIMCPCKHSWPCPTYQEKEGITIHFNIIPSNVLLPHLQAADYLDAQAEKAGRVLRKKKSAARKWYHRFVLGKDDWDEYEAFYLGFVGGSLTGVLSGLIL